MRRSLVLLAGLAMLAALVTSSGDSTEPGPAASREDGGGGAAVELPSVELREIATGDAVNLSSLLPARQPLLVWAWAPH